MADLDGSNVSGIHPSYTTKTLAATFACAFSTRNGPQTTFCCDDHSPMTIGQRIKDYVEKHTAWSFAQFCELVGVSYETGRKWVKGETAPNRNRAKVIAD